MPQLNETKAAEVHDVENRGGILEPGVYEVVLKDVEARPGKVAPMWTWKFEIPEGHPRAGRQFFHNTSLADNALWKLRETFDAFGVDTTTNTDTLIGRKCKALVYKSIAEQGKRQGQFVNAIQELMPLSGSAPGVGAVKVGAPTEGSGSAGEEEAPFLRR